MKTSITIKLIRHCLVLVTIIRITVTGIEFFCLESISQCVCDQTKLLVDCSNMGFSDVPIANLPNDTSSFSFGGNRIAVVLQGTFVKLESLSSLSLDNNIIGYIESGSFAEPSSLKRLDLSGNRLSSFPLALRVLTSLEVLSLSGNALSYLSADDLLDFTQLEILRLENNAIYSIPETAFDTLPILSTLYLNGNLLSIDPVGWFKTCTVLTRLNLSDNSLQLTSKVEDWFQVSSNVPLMELHLDGNNMEAIRQETFRSCVNLKELTLDLNAIATIAAGSFNDLVQLQNLSLSSNYLTELPDDLFQTTEGVLSLSLEGNTLSRLSADLFNGLSQLEELNLAGNQLVNLFTTSCVEARNTVVSCVTASAHLPALISLDLQSNFLSSAPGVENFKNLELLNLGDNVITHITDFAFNGTSLKYIFLHDNLLSTMSLENFQVLPGLEHVTISGNPWECNCSLFWVLDPEAEYLVWKEALYDAIVCSKPNVAENLDLTSLYLYRPSVRKSGPFVACEEVNLLTIIVIIVVWCVVSLIVFICYLQRTVTYPRGYYAQTLKKAKPPGPTQPPSSPLPGTGFLNAGSTIDELEKSNATEITFLASPGRPESRHSRDRRNSITPIEDPQEDPPSPKRSKCSVADTPV